MEVRMAYRLLSLLLCGVASGWAQEPKPVGTMLDAEGFAAISSFCVETTHLSRQEASEVRAFLKRETRPGKLLPRITWQLRDPCGANAVDAVIRARFPRLAKLPVRPGKQDEVEPTSEEPLATKALAEISQPRTAVTLYRVEAVPLDNPLVDPDHPTPEPLSVQRQMAMYGAFQTLTED